MQMLTKRNRNNDIVNCT